MTGMDDLVTWLRAQLDDDERVAREAGRWALNWRAEGGDEVVDPEDQVVASAGPNEHIARWDPARVLAEVDAKRRILDLHRPDTTRYVQPKCHECSGCGCCSVDHPCDTIKLLALPYAERDGYREEWMP